MSIEVFRNFFSIPQELYDDVKIYDYWPTTIVSRPGPVAEVHWHETDIVGYVCEGEADFLEANSGNMIRVATGDKFVLPAGTLHQEKEVREQVVYVLAMPEARVVGTPILTLNSPEALADWKAGR